MSFFLGFEDELVKLAQVPYGGRPPEISRKPAVARKFDWKGFDKKFKAEAGTARRRRAFKEKGGLTLLPPKRNPWKHKPPPGPPQPKPAKKKGKGRRRKPAAVAKPKLQKIKPQVRIHTGVKRVPHSAASPGLRAAQNPRALWPWKKKKKVKPASASTTQVDPTVMY